MPSSSRILVLALFLGLGCVRHVETTAPVPVSVVRTPIVGPIQIALSQGADDADISVRRRALDILIRFDPEPGGARYARRSIFDPSPYVQAVAVSALASRLPEPEAQALLLEAAFRREANAYTRGRAALAVARHADSITRAQICPLWKVAEAGWETAPLALAAAVTGDHEAEHALAIILGSGVLPMDQQFFMDVGQSGMASLIPPLEKALENTDEDLKPLVMVSLAELHSSDGINHLRQNMLQGDEDYRFDMLELISGMQNSEIDELIRDSWKGMSTYYRRFAKLVLFSRGGAPLYVAVSAARSSDRDLRSFALSILSGRIESGKVEVGSRERSVGRQLGITGLRDPEDTVRIEAVRLLGLVGRPEDRQLVVPFLSDEIPITRVEAAGSLQRLGGMP